jgi:hypothetical protein
MKIRFGAACCLFEVKMDTLKKEIDFDTTQVTMVGEGSQYGDAPTNSENSAFAETTFNFDLKDSNSISIGNPSLDILSPTNFRRNSELPFGNIITVLPYMQFLHLITDRNSCLGASQSTVSQRSENSSGSLITPPVRQGETFSDFQLERTMQADTQVYNDDTIVDSPIKSIAAPALFPIVESDSDSDSDESQDLIGSQLRIYT